LRLDLTHTIVPEKFTVSIDEFRKKIDHFPLSQETRIIAGAWVDYVLSKSDLQLASAHSVGKSLVAEWNNGLTIGFTSTGELLIKINEDRPPTPRANANYTRVDASVNCTDPGKTISQNR